MEQHLDDLDRTLLERNEMTLIRVYLNGATKDVTQRVDDVARGRLIKVALPLPEGEAWNEALAQEDRGGTAKKLLRDFVLYNPLVWWLFGRRYMLRRAIPHRPGEPLQAGSVVGELLDRYSVNLVMLHFLGGADSDEVVQQAMLRNIPLGAQNHFSNDRFNNLSIRKHATLARAVAGINGIGVPAYLRHRFTNLSNGIDTELFSRANARPIPYECKDPLILQPSRVIRAKGQLDLIKATAALRKLGLKVRVAFAGRIDSMGYLEELQSEIAKHGLQEVITFVGTLGKPELRDWYAASSVVAFPTYHHEGLGRVTVEAQAMGVPPIVYDTGGVAEGLIPDCTGFLIQTGDIGGLTHKLLLLLTNHGLRRQMGKAGRRFVEERFSLGALAARHEIFYRRILRSKALCD